jgi:hypothetical protein
MKKLLFITSLLISNLIYSQNPPAPPPAQAPPSSNEEFNSTQNNILGTQSKSFGGGSIIKPNPMLTSADFAFIQNPTFETGWRLGSSLCFSKINKGKGMGVNAVLTFDLTQQTYSVYYRRNNWYYHYNLGRMGMTFNTGLSVTRVWEPKKIKKLTLGVQMGLSTVSGDYAWFRGGKKYSNDAYIVSVPYVVLIANKEINIKTKVKWTPEIFITLCSPYYDIENKKNGNSSTFNSVVGNNIAFKVSKIFKMNINWRMNINTTPKFGIMNIILIGGNLDF